jgi:hypothetical protein
MELSLSSVDGNGLMNVTSYRDWLRVGMGGYNIEANSILYYTLSLGSTLANHLNDHSVLKNYTATQSRLPTSLNILLWNDTAGLFNDNTTDAGSAVQPLDGNVWAVKSGVCQNRTRDGVILGTLEGQWGQFGGVAIEVRILSLLPPPHFVNHSLTPLTHRPKTPSPPSYPHTTSSPDYTPTAPHPL